MAAKSKKTALSLASHVPKKISGLSSGEETSTMGLEVIQRSSFSPHW
jgi:hypothetical protein